MKFANLANKLLFGLLLLTWTLSCAANKPLSVKVFHGGEDHFGFAINSAIVMGEKTPC